MPRLLARSVLDAGSRQPELKANITPSRTGRVRLTCSRASTLHSTRKIQTGLALLLISPWLAEVARNRFDDPGAIVVPNGIDLNLFQAPPRGKRARSTVGFLYAPGSPHKGTAMALSVINNAARYVPGLHVRAFGIFKLSPLAPLPPGSDYTERPPQHLLREIYADCDVWLCTSTSEGYHLPPHEAMACRCPVVSTRVRGPMDLIKDGVNGHLLDTDDVNGLTNRLVEVLKLSEPAWQRMSEAAYESIRHFTWEEAAIVLEGALKVAIERFGNGRPGLSSTNASVA
jgi:glycosyltransferase involved in cell wall biosynthesis